MQKAYQDYMLEQVARLMTIPAVSGYSGPMERYLAEQTRLLGYAPTLLRQGGVVAELGGAGNGLLLLAHGDELGLMVRKIMPNGRLRVVPCGGLHAQYCDRDNVTVITRGGGRYSGTIQQVNASTHIATPEHRTELRSFDANMEIVLDEDVRSREDTEALGVRVGDVAALEPRYVLTPSGYLKGRFLDDKACVALLFSYMKFLQDTGKTPCRNVWVDFTLFEEIGHGATCGIPEGVEEVMALDVGSVGEATDCDEHKVFICAKDAAFPYHYDTVTRLLETAEQRGIPHTIDIMYPSYGSDVNGTLRAGYDVRHCLIGPGVLATHGYERTHLDALTATFDLLTAYTGVA